MPDEKFDAKEKEDEVRYTRLYTISQCVTARFRSDIELYLQTSVFSLDDRQFLYQCFKDNLKNMVYDLERPHE